MERVQEAKRLRSDTAGEAERLTASAVGEELGRLYSLHPCQTIHELRANGKLEILGGGTPSKKNKAFWEGDIPWISPKDMKSWIIEDAEDRISSKAIDASSAKLMRVGAVLVVVRGMILARKWPIAIAGIYLTINQDMKALLPRESILSEYLGYILRGLEPHVLDQVETAAHGTRRLKSDTLEALRIPIAPIAEQQRLVAYLDSIQAQAAALKRAQEDTDAELRRLEQAILDRAFRGEL
jgi:type I restriction enzyme S subunit